MVLNFFLANIVAAMKRPLKLKSKALLAYSCIFHYNLTRGLPCAVLEFEASASDMTTNGNVGKD